VTKKKKKRKKYKKSTLCDLKRESIWLRGECIKEENLSIKCT